MGYLGRNPSVGTQRMLDSIESQFNGSLATFDLRYGGNPTYPTLSESLIVSLGGVLQEPGEAYYVSSDKIVFSEPPNAGTECWILLYSQYGAAASSAPALSLQSTGEPMGHEDRTHSSISFDNGTRTFSIAPNTSDGHTSYVVWTKGTKRIVTESKSVQIGTATGLYYIYFDAFGELQYRTTYFDWANDTPTAYVYWNATTSSAPFVADERHGIVLDWQTHEYLHRTRGAVIANGFSISNYTTTGDGDANSDAQFDLGNGTFFDEDLEVNITHSATPSAGTFTQVLTGNAEIPVYYLSGSEGDWVRDTATEFACKQSATTLQYNSLSGATWSTTPATNNRYVVSWVVATNEINAPIIAILGQAQYSSIGSAEATAWGDLTLTNFPIVEFRPLWKIIFRTNSGYANTPNAYIANVLDLREFTSIGVSGSIVSDHGLLSGLADDDHAQYLNTTVDRVGVTANIVTTGNITAANLIATGQLQGPANFIIDPAAIGDDTGTVEIKGNLTVQGTTTTVNSTTTTVNQIKLGDNDKALFGDGDDLEIFHNGSLSYIRDTGTGPLYIQGSDAYISNLAGEWAFKATAGSIAQLGYASSKKLETTSTGINVTGDGIFSGNVGIGTDNPPLKLTVYGTNEEDLIYLSTGNNAGDTFANIRGDNESGIRIRGGGSYDGGTIELSGGLRDTDPGVIKFSTGTGISVDERVRITSTGNVGIGTISPEEKLHVRGNVLLGTSAVSGSSSAFKISANNTSASNHTITLSGHPNGTNDTVIWDLNRSGGAYGTFDLRFANVSRFFVAGSSLANNGNITLNPYNNTIFSNGNVGIGTTNPYSKLGLRGDITLGLNPSPGNSYGKVSWRYNNSSSFGAAGYIDVVQVSAGNSGHMIFATNNNTPDSSEPSEKLRIDSSGNVGIGTDNPGAKLDVYQGEVQIRSSAAYNTHLNYQDAGSHYFTVADSGATIFRGSSNGITAAIIYGGGNAQFNGNVGIGTANPTFGQSTPISTYDPKLGIQGSIMIGNLSTTASDRYELQFYRRSGAAGQPIDTHDMGRIAWYGSSNDNNNANLAWSIGVNPDGGGWTSGANRKGYMTFNNHNGELIRITSSGVIRHGTNLYSGSYTGEKIVIAAEPTAGDTSTVVIGEEYAGSANPSISLFRRDGSTLYSGYGYRISNFVGKLNFSYASPALPGNHSFDPKVTFTQTGNVGIGTTNPSQKLHVMGNAIITGNLTLGIADSASAHINSYELMTFNIDSDNDDTNRYFAWYKNGGDGGGTQLLKLDEAGELIPGADAAQNLGSPTSRWANIYSADLQLSNEGSANEVDGTWGAYTIQEGEEALYLINRRSGKKFKFVLEEVKD